VQDCGLRCHPRRFKKPKGPRGGATPGGPRTPFGLLRKSTSRHTDRLGGPSGQQGRRRLQSAASGQARSGRGQAGVFAEKRPGAGGKRPAGRARDLVKGANGNRFFLKREAFAITRARQGLAARLLQTRHAAHGSPTVFSRFVGPRGVLVRPNLGLPPLNQPARKTGAPIRGFGVARGRDRSAIKSFAWKNESSSEAFPSGHIRVLPSSSIKSPVVS